MQENLKNILDALRYQYEEKFVGNKIVFSVCDPDRLLFLVQFDKDSKDNIEFYVDYIMSEVMSEDLNEDVYVYGNYSVRKILWDIYIIFVCLEEVFNQEEIFSIQRDANVMKKYVVQGTGIKMQLSRIISPEKEIDAHLKSVDVMYDEQEICKQLCELDIYGRRLLTKGLTRYNEIVEELKLINNDTYGENQ